MNARAQNRARAHAVDVSGIAHRVARRLLDPDRETERGAERERPTAARRRSLVTVDCLRGLAPGARFEIDEGTIVTPLAREHAWSAGIHFVKKSAARSAGGRACLRVAVGADHGGVALKAEVLAWLGELGHAGVDLGTHDEVPCDYPAIARAVAEAVASGDADFGVCIDGAGIGSAMAANKVPGVLAAHCFDRASAHGAREHNHANLLTLAGGLARAHAHDVLCTFLATPAGTGRHRRRVALVRALDRRGPSS